MLNKMIKGLSILACGGAVGGLLGLVANTDLGLNLIIIASLSYLIYYRLAIFEK